VTYADNRVIAWGLLVITALTVWLAFWPGLISPDSNQTIYQASINQYTNWWTPFGAWLLHWWLQLGLPISGVFAVAVSTVVCGMYLCARFCFRRVPASLVALVICVLPPVYGALSGLSRDLFFLGFTFLGFGLFGRLVQGRARSRAAEAWLAISSIACLTMAYLCRQNAIASVFALMLGLAFWWRKRRAGSARKGWLRELGFGISVAAVTTAVIAGCTLVIYSVAGVRSVYPQRFTYVYDLASISVLSHHDQFPAVITQKRHPGWVSPPYSDERNIERLFKPNNVITLYPANAAGAINFASSGIASREDSILRAAWRRSITAEPIDYAWGRIRLMAIQLGLWDHPTDAYLPLLSPNNFGYPLVFPGNYRFASRVLAHFVGPDPVWLPLDYPWTWLLLIMLCMALLYRRLGGLTWYFCLLPLAVVINYVALLAVSVAAGFRYVTFEVPVAVLMSGYVIAAAAMARDRWCELVDPSFRALAGGGRSNEAGPISAAEPHTGGVPASRRVSAKPGS
jgi:hypothetical protein